MDYTSFCATMVAGASVRVVYGAWMERGLISNALMFDWSPGLWTLQRALILLPLLSVGQWAHRAWRGLQPGTRVGGKGGMGVWGVVVGGLSRSLHHRSTTIVFARL